MLSSALKVLGERPDIQALLRSERDRIPNFIEETLRIESPVKGDFRLSRLPTTVGGVDIPAGTTVMVMNGAANRDPRQFEQPDEFDVARPNAHRHIAFGRGEWWSLHQAHRPPTRKRGQRSGSARQPSRRE